MTSYTWLSIVLVMLALILPVSSLMRRNLPLRSWLTTALAWVAIFAVAILVIGWLTS